MNLVWGEEFPLHLTLAEEGPVEMRLAAAATPSRIPGAAQPLVEILAVGHGRAVPSLTGRRTEIGARLRYVEHAASDDVLLLRQRDPVSQLEASTRVARVGRGDSYRFTTVVTNGGAEPILLQAVSSACLGGISKWLGQTSQLCLWTSSNECFAENRWSAERLSGPPGLPNPHPVTHHQPARGVMGRTGTSTWSTGLHQPMGVLEGPSGTIAFQVEASGPWHWEVCSLYHPDDWIGLLLYGPTDLQHSWSHLLPPGQSFASVPVSIAAVRGDLTDAIESLTEYRRSSRRVPAADHGRPLVFNDYMNTLMGDPTADRLLPLIDAAAEAGAAYFCIDAGWYDDDGDWWPSVGLWRPSATRFAPLGLEGVMHRIRERGMRPGLWIEPEVVGVRSPVAKALPDEAFMRRQGRRIVESNRYFLDLRSQAARDHLDEVIERLVVTYGAEYLKWDYNVTPGSGPNHAASSPGDGLLEHTRALLAWVDRLRERHPGVILEACSSGAQRQDSEILARFDLQSTSDQQDPMLYPPIAAGAPMSMPLEQAANWAYPQPAYDLELNALTLVSGLSGRMYLSGRLDLLDREQLALVREATALYPEVMRHHETATPVWPIGLPQWDDRAVVLGSRSGPTTLLFVWNRGADVLEIPMAELVGRGRVEIVFPLTVALADWDVTWDEGRRSILVDFAGAVPSARILRLRCD